MRKIKKIKNGNFWQVVCKDNEEMSKALLSIPSYSHRREGVGKEIILFFKRIQLNPL